MTQDQIIPHAYKVIGNFISIEISLNERWSDSLYYRFDSCATPDYVEEEWKEVEIQFHTKTGRAYFTTEHGAKQYLDEFMKF